MNRIVKRKLNEAYSHIKPYMDEPEEVGELHEMCKHCERWSGKEHDYKECEDMMCFKFWLAYEYLCWETSWE